MCAWGLSQSRAEQFEIDAARSSASVLVVLGASTGVANAGIEGSILAVIDAANQTLRIDDLNISFASGASTMFTVQVGVQPFGDVPVIFSQASVSLHAPIPGHAVSVSSGGAWTLNTCSVHTIGSLMYVAEGLTCDRLTNDGVSCAAMTNLASLAPSPALIADGLLVETGSARELSGQLTFTQPIHPALGASAGAVTYTVRFVATSAACSVDYDNSGSADVADLFGFLDAWFVQQGQAGPGLATDYDNDLVVTVDDLFGFLDAWFIGC